MRNGFFFGACIELKTLQANWTNEMKMLDFS